MADTTVHGRRDVLYNELQLVRREFAMVEGAISAGGLPVDGVANTDRRADVVRRATDLLDELLPAETAVLVDLEAKAGSASDAIEAARRKVEKARQDEAAARSAHQPVLDRLRRQRQRVEQLDRFKAKLRA